MDVGQILAELYLEKGGKTRGFSNQSQARVRRPCVHRANAATRREFVGRCLEKRRPKPRGFSNQFFQSIINPPIALKLMRRANRRFHAKIISRATRKYEKN